MDDRRTAVEGMHHVERLAAQMATPLPNSPGIEAGPGPAPDYARGLDDLNARLFLTRDLRSLGGRGGENSDGMPQRYQVARNVVAPQERTLPGRIMIQHQDAHTTSRERFSLGRADRPPCW